MPTFDRTLSFDGDWERLSDDQKKTFLRAVRKFVEDLKAGGHPRPGLYVEHVEGSNGIYEMSWDRKKNGRATFAYGDSIREGEPHVIWRRIGGHEIYGRP